MLNNNKIIGHIFAFITVFIWGTTFISTKVILDNLIPIEIAFFRFLIGFIALMILYPKYKKPNSLKEEFGYFILGLTGVVIYFLFENMALQHSLASNVSLLITTTPILTAVFAHFTTKDEKMNSKSIMGFVIAILGVFLVVFNGQFILKLSPLGDILALSAALFWSIYCVILKGFNKENPILVARKSFFYGVLIFIPLIMIFGVDLRVENTVDLPLILNLVYLGIGASALGFVLWNNAIKIIGVVNATNYIYLVPLITMVASVIILKEEINSYMLVGGLLILLGVYICQNGLDGFLRLRVQLSQLKKRKVRE
jgi:drug/metabolite transporter (DMT)-like permease